MTRTGYWRVRRGLGAQGSCGTRPRSRARGPAGPVEALGATSARALRCQWRAPRRRAPARSAGGARRGSWSDSVTLYARLIMVLILAARKPRPVRTASGAADTVAPHTELLVRSPVTSGARRRLEPRARPVLPPARRQPSGWVRARGGGARRHPAARVTVDARAFRVARRADAWVGPCFLGVPCRKAGAVQSGKRDVVERQPRGQRGDGALTMARGALPLGMTARAQVALARRPRAVLAHPVAVVDEVIVRSLSVVAEVDVTSVAVAQRPLIAVLVAAEARGHLRQHGLRTRLGRLDVAANAISPDRQHVSSVFESKP